MLSRFNVVARETGLKGNCLCRRVMVSRFYSSKDPSDKNTSPQELLDNDHFWELPTPKTPARRPSKATNGDTIDFRQLLDSVLKTRQTQENNHILEGVSHKTSKQIEPTNNDSVKPKLRTTSLIEKRLLQMVMQQRQIFKQKAPLPRTMMPAIYRKSAANNRNDVDGSTYKQRNTTLDAAQSDIIRQNKSIQDHDHEIKTIDDLLSTKSRHRLLDMFITSMLDYQQQNTFPSYYSRLVKNAIHHAYNDFYDPYLAMALFEQCKTISVQSYIEGCTVDVYNQVLQIRWDAWKDIYGMLDLMEEMTLNGIAFDKVSAGIVQTITDEMEQQEWSGGENTEHVRLWSPDDIRSTELMKTLVGKWIFK
ncbi:hypothetical protein BCR42DRAFT_487863 [Absidia repens]|uniref:Mtf2-like C-terminal domain-containing protein n=1 Tax=Absidia repens TaxID=90262 RepID=A0A1X2IU11_9FUNG|nr:hypothetical protein BCR42DRAFT_487863 [Absidia repens]